MEYQEMVDLVFRIPVVTGSDLKQFLGNYVATDRKFLDKYSGQLEHVMMAEVVLRLRKRGLVEELELLQTNYRSLLNTLTLMPDLIKE